jgi:hypothetical protein
LQTPSNTAYWRRILPHANRFPHANKGRCRLLTCGDLITFSQSLQWQFAQEGAHMGQRNLQFGQSANDIEDRISGSIH